MAYRPTSLDFINRPNPVEPHTDPHKHPLHADQNHLRLLHDTNNAGPSIGPGEPPGKRRKSGDGLSNDISRPTLPAVKQPGEKRLRIPPTLSGLHQPPPDAGILPSISVNGLHSVELVEMTAPLPPQIDPARAPSSGQDRPSKTSEQQTAAISADQESSSETTEAASESKPAKSRKNKKWTEPETTCLLKGVEKHGIGNWTKILKDQDFEFDERRSALDLKDRFRICCPDHYKTTRKSRAPETSASAIKIGSSDVQSPKEKRVRTTHRKTEAELRKLGIGSDFAQSSRRKRTAYSKAEDDTILKGFRRYGQKWLQIQQDESLGLESRTPMDLRDRMRTRWPQEYKNAGLKLRAEKNAHEKESEGKGSKKKAVTKLPQRNIPSEMQAQAGSSSRKPDARTEEPAISRPQNEQREPSTAIAPTKKITAPFLSAADDVFWGLPLDADEERVTLDRRILDWPLDFSRNPTSSNIDPISTLNLPRPNALPTMQAGPLFQSSVSASTLPSLAAVTAGSLQFDFGEQLELPSLLEGFGALDGEVEGEGTDVRSGVGAGGLGMMSLDEILG